MTAMVGPGIPAGVIDATGYTHYGLLAGIENYFASGTSDKPGPPRPSRSEPLLVASNVRHVAGAERDEEEARRWYHGVKAPGSDLPGVITAGRAGRTSGAHRRRTARSISRLRTPLVAPRAPIVQEPMQINRILEPTV